MSLQSFRRNLRAAWLVLRGESQPPAEQPDLLQFMLPPTGQEVFTPQPLLAHRIYRITFSGLYEYTTYGLIFSTTHLADAAYEQDTFFNLSKRYHGLYINGVNDEVDEFDSWREVRALHQYSCRIEGEDEYVPFRLVAPQGHSSGFIRTCVELLPFGTPSVKAKVEQVRKSREETKGQEAKAREEAEAQAQQAVIVRQKQELEAAPPGKRLPSGLPAS
jgi:hypothetical protein